MSQGINFDWNYRDTQSNNHDRASWLRDNFLRPHHDEPVVQTKAAYFDTERLDASPRNPGGVLQPESSTLFNRHDPTPDSRLTYSYIAPSKLGQLQKEAMPCSAQTDWKSMSTGQPVRPIRKPMAMPAPDPVLMSSDLASEQNLNQLFHILHKPRRIYHW